MLRAFDNHLRKLAETTNGQFREELRKRVNGNLTDDQVATLKEFIFLMPSTLKQLTRYWNRKSTPADAKRLSGFMMTYIYQPKDFLPEDTIGLFGYLDDSYMVVQTYLKIQDHFLPDWHEKTAEELELSNRARKLITAPRLVIPEVTQRIDRMLDELVAGDETDFDRLIAEMSS
jgi:uncharacterized membrane protein YkvA (DUF1232 family)